VAQRASTEQQRRILLEATGTVVILEGDTFIRRNLDEVATPGWKGDVSLEPYT